MTSLFNKSRILFHKARRLAGRIDVRPVPEEWVQSPCLFGMSTGRCGTTTLTKLFALSPEVRAYHEPSPGVTNPIRVEPYYAQPDERERLAGQFKQLRARTLLEHSRQGVTYVEVNGMKFHAAVIAQLMPGARFFFVHRHPAEYVRSGMRRGWYESHPADVTRLQPRPDDPAAGLWEQWERFEKICWLWKTTNEYLLDCLRDVEQERAAMFPFASLMDAGSGQWRELFRLAGVEPPAEADVEEVLSVRHNAQTTGEDLDLSNLSAAHQNALASIAGPTMERLGYDSSGSVLTGQTS